MLGVAEGTWGIVHRPDDIAGEGQRGIMRCGLFGECRHIIVPLGPIDALGGEQVRISTLPTTGYGSTVEVHQQMVTGGTLHQFDAIVHVHLVVAREEVDLHTSHPDLLAPGKFLLTILRFVQTVLGCWRTIHPTHGRVVPDHRLDALRLGVVDGILNGLVIFHRIPLGIDEHVGEMESNGEIDIFLDNVIVVAAVVIGPIDPRHHTWTNPTGILEFTGF